jgi:hypothetical protein
MDDPEQQDVALFEEQHRPLRTSNHLRADESPVYDSICAASYGQMSRRSMIAYVPHRQDFGGLEQVLAGRGQRVANALLEAAYPKMLSTSSCNDAID